MSDVRPTLVAKDRRTKLLMSHVVPCKGADQEWVVAQAQHFATSGAWGTTETWYLAVMVNPPWRT